VRFRLAHVAVLQDLYLSKLRAEHLGQVAERSHLGWCECPGKPYEAYPHRIVIAEGVGALLVELHILVIVQRPSCLDGPVKVLMSLVGGQVAIQRLSWQIPAADASWLSWRRCPSRCRCNGLLLLSSY